MSYCALILYLVDFHFYKKVGHFLVEEVQGRPSDDEEVLPDYLIDHWFFSG